METFELHTTNKKLAAKLYRIYAEKFPNHGYFWSSLAEEETVGAGQIQIMVEASPSIPTPREIAVSGKKPDSLSMLLEKELKLAHESRLSLLHALTAAFEIEQVLSEVASFNILGAVSPEVKKAYMHVLAADRSHVDQIRLAMAKFS